MKINFGKLPKAFKIKWLKALRSGDYKQGTNTLKQSINVHRPIKDGYEYCCLGVAAEIVGCKNIQGGTFHRGCEIRGVSKIPDILRGDSSNNKLVGHLIEMNDDKGWNFNYIADWIEQNL